MWSAWPVDVFVGCCDTAGCVDCIPCCAGATASPSPLPNGHAYDDFGAADGRSSVDGSESKVEPKRDTAPLHLLPKEAGFFAEFVNLLAVTAQGRSGYAERQCQVLPMPVCRIRWCWW